MEYLKSPIDGVISFKFEYAKKEISTYEIMNCPWFLQFMAFIRHYINSITFL